MGERRSYRRDLSAHAGFLAFFVLALLLPDARAGEAQPPTRGPVFSGVVLGTETSQGTLTLSADFVTDRTLRWQSFDTVLGNVDTGFFQPETWKLNADEEPARLIFRGSAGGTTIAGDVLFAPHNRAVIDVKTGGKRVRYTARLRAE